MVQHHIILAHICLLPESVGYHDARDSRVVQEPKQGLCIKRRM